MEPIIIKNLSFAYPGQAPLFDHCQLNLSSDWKLGLLGRNGRGKTTLLKLLQGQLAYQGSIQANLDFSYFPPSIDSSNDLAGNAISRLAPEQWKVERELNLLHTNPAILWAPYETLSGGERTKLSLAALFAQDKKFILLDEPTNHLDQRGRKEVASYLQKKKQGFIVVSHDQRFLDQIIDHTLVIERQQLVLGQGNYAAYFHEKARRDQEASSNNQKLKSSIQQLQTARNQRQQWAQRAESEKKNNAHADKGFIGAKAAKMMKKSTTMEKRLDKAIRQKQGLLQNIEQIVPLSINYLPNHHPVLLALDKISLSFPGRTLIQGLSFQIRSHEQVLLCGDNGTGKTSLFKAITGHFNGQAQGTIQLAHNCRVSLVRQNYHYHGSLRNFAQQNRLEYDQFLNLLRKLGMERSSFSTPIEEMSMGQQKKVELARSLAEPASLYLWDEPLNYLDTYNQQQLIQLIKKFRPPMLIIEHDQHFISEVAGKVITIKSC